jgi:type I restriction enzyme M protein
MLDNETKRRIDTARDILVGKVPDPKSQVEQITIALVYKFMDDMDKESVEMGGKASFFTGEFKRFAWSKIFDPRIGGHEMLNLYSEAIDKMNVNPNIPQLFRDIFKNAYLPYRDPETLKLFLKTINEFTYEHSERLGDAFEYLLSVLGSQGDAGQFRTPRHIIDFMVQVVNPQKRETILDPACGTAGFLISAYKHIVRENTSPNHRLANGNNRGDLLNTDERKKLLTNFKGYDISPDMVRLSLVNLYLHGFVQPQILEYDTLTSEERWNEYADVILANPPFMSPKGGIKPHKKFSVPSNRSEVLFVDYIAEHLRPTGRAAVIVPEGIIFQSAGAYKQLRKMLVDNHLFAVVSLPAGIFNPYSGVKTSILFMDRQLAKKCDSILFVKIENDGYGLGAQRREQTGSDLPDAVNVISDYMKAARSGALNSFNVEEKPCGALLVKKEKLAENEEYNLTGDRYRATERRVNQKWPMVNLGDVCEEFKSGFACGKSEKETGDILHLRPMNISSKGTLVFGGSKYIEKKEFDISYSLKAGDVLFNNTNSKELVGKTCYISKDIVDAGYSNHMTRIRTNSQLNSQYLATTLQRLFEKGFFLNLCNKWVGQAGVNNKALSEIEIPLPPLEVQREIVAEIEGYQKIIDGAQQVVENCKPQIEIDPEWPMMKLGEAYDVISGYSFDSKDFLPINPIKCIKITNVGVNEFINDEKGNVPSDYLTKYSSFIANTGDIVISLTRSIISSGLKIAIVPESWNNSLVNQRVAMIKPKNDQNIKYLFSYLSSASVYRYVEEKSKSLMQPNLSINDLKALPVPIPPVEIQYEITTKIEAERKVVNGCKDLIALYEAKIKQVIDKVWED